MNDALASAWAEIRKSHRRVPRAVVVTGRERSCGAVNWADQPVIVVGQPTFAPRTPDAVLHALLHQAAHGLLGGTSGASAGRWHDLAYRDAAAALGLETVPESKQGWHGSTVMPDTTRDRYGRALEDLGTALVGDPPGGVSTSGRNGIIARCGCPPSDRLTIRIRGNPEDVIKKLKAREIRCGRCGQLYKAVTSPAEPG